MARHAFFLRTFTIAMFTIAGVYGVVLAWFAVEAALHIASRDELFIKGTLPAEVLVLAPIGALAIYLFYRLGTRATLFLSRYDIIDDKLVCEDPVWRARNVVSLSAVRRIESFWIIGPPSGTPATRGHTIVDESGGRVCVSEALPLWDEIVRRCGSASVQEMPPIKQTRL